MRRVVGRDSPNIFRDQGAPGLLIQGKQPEGGEPPAQRRRSTEVPLIRREDLIRVEPVGKYDVDRIGQAYPQVTVPGYDMPSGAHVVEVKFRQVVCAADEVVDDRNFLSYPGLIQHHVVNLCQDERRYDRRLRQGIADV